SPASCPLPASLIHSMAWCKTRAATPHCPGLRCPIARDDNSARTGGNRQRACHSQRLLLDNVVPVGYPGSKADQPMPCMMFLNATALSRRWPLFGGRLWAWYEPTNGTGFAQATPGPAPKAATTRAPSRADILRGEYGPYRSNNDLLYYHLDVRVDPVKQTI